MQHTNSRFNTKGAYCQEVAKVYKMATVGSYEQTTNSIEKAALKYAVDS